MMVAFRVLLGVLVLMGAWFSPGASLDGARVWAEDEAPAADEPEEGQIPEAVRLAQIKQIAKKLRKKARSPRAEKYREEILQMLESLGTLGGYEAADAALDAVPMNDEKVRDAIFALVDEEHHTKLLKPLVALLENRKNRRDFDLKKRVAHSLSVVGDPDAVPPLTELIRTDEDAEVVAAAADSLATFGAAPLRVRKEAVKKLVDVYTSTYNLMMSIRPEDRVIAGAMEKRWQVYNRSLRAALQALTGATEVSRPQEWREWWNDHKKRNDW